MLTTVVLAAVGLAGANTLAACSGDNSDTSSPKRSAPKQLILSTEALTSAVLDGADLSSEYGAVAEDPVYSEAPKYFCNYAPPSVYKVRVGRSFVAAADVNQSISVSIRQFENDKAAKASFAALSEAMETCKSETTRGSTTNYTTSVIPDVGDGALRIGAANDGGGYTQYFAFKGPAVISVVGGGSATGIPDDAILDDLLAKQLERYVLVSAARAAKDADADGDDVPDVSDAFPFNASEAADANRNGIGDNADAAITRRINKAKFLNKHDLAIVMKDPASHAGRVLKIWGNVTQFDSATGTSSFLANIASTNTTSYGYFEGDDAFFYGDPALLEKVVEDDTFTATVRVVGSYTYDTAAGGTNTTPYMEVNSIQVQ